MSSNNKQSQPACYSTLDCKGNAIRSMNVGLKLAPGTTVAACRTCVDDFGISDDQPREVWYRLLNSSGGPFENMQAISLELAPSATSTQEFRRKVKLANLDILRERNAHQLLVFANETSLAMKQSLDSSDSLKCLGWNCLKNAIIVVVPENGSTRWGWEPEPIPLSKWFISDLWVLDRVELHVDEWLSMTYNGSVLNLELDIQAARKDVEFQCFEMDFPILLSQGRRQKVFVRPCYEKLFDMILVSIKENDRSVTVTGNPGIGKSRFYAYCILRLIKAPIEGKILVINADSSFYVLENGAFRELFVRDLGPYKQNWDVIRLIDGQSTDLLGWRGLSILFTTPGCPNYSTFRKSPGCEYVMPPWTYQELSIAATKLFQLDEEKVRERFDLFGGIAQYVLVHDESEAASNLEMALLKVDLPKLVRSVTLGGEVGERNGNDWLVHMYPSHANKLEYRSFFLNFASKEVTDRIFRRMIANSYGHLRNFLMTHQEYSYSTRLRRALFEVLCHRLWSSRGATLLTGRYLTVDSTSIQAFSILIPDTVRTFRFSLLDDIPVFNDDEPLYCRPIGNTYPCIDAIYWDTKTCFLLQMAVSESHEITHAPLVTILHWCQGRKLRREFVFVVPMDRVIGYPLQHIVTMAGTVCEGLILTQGVVGVQVELSLDAVRKEGSAFGKTV